MICTLSDACLNVVVRMECRGPRTPPDDDPIISGESAFGRPSFISHRVHSNSESYPLYSHVFLDPGDSIHENLRRNRSAISNLSSSVNDQFMLEKYPTSQKLIQYPVDRPSSSTSDALGRYFTYSPFLSFVISLQLRAPIVH